jgi:hypothetical protein
LQPFTDVIITRWGVVKEVLRKPGFYWLGGVGVEKQEVYVGGWNGHLEDISISDCQAFPCFISATYNYQVVDALSATYKIPDFQEFVKIQAKSALQKAFSNAIYNNYHQNVIENKIVSILQEYVSPVGIQINTFRITAIKVSKKMCKHLMAKQEAQAYINGRKAIAESATSIMATTVKKLQKDNIQLTPKEKNALVMELIYMIMQNDEVKVRFMEGNPSDLEAITAITIEPKDNPNNQENI